jgi:hypothetical protein
MRANVVRIALTSTPDWVIVRFPGADHHPDGAGRFTTRRGKAPVETTAHHAEDEDQ